VALFSFPDIPLGKEEYLIEVRDNSEKQLRGYFEFVEKQDGKAILKPLKFSLANIPRRENRKILVSSEKSGPYVYISNIISDFIIRDQLSKNQKKIEAIKHAIMVKLENVFASMKIFLTNEGINPRMNMFRETIMPLFIKDLLKEEPGNDNTNFNFYMENIHSKDLTIIKRPELVSEISVPIVHNMKIPYGFVQINNNIPMDEKNLTLVKKMAVVTDQLITKNGILSTGNDRVQVMDVSPGGLALKIDVRSQIRFFKENSLLYFDLFMPENRKANILGIVRNIIATGATIRIGIQIKEIDALSEVIFEEFLDTL